MADSVNRYIGLAKADIDNGRELYEHLLRDDETVELSFESVRDKFIITSRKIIFINIQGLTGKKKEFMVIPYSKISCFACESAGAFDLDAELKIWASGLGKIEFAFVRDTDIRPIGKILSKYI